MDENNSNVRRIKRSNNIKQNGGDKKHDSNGTEFNRFEIYYIRYWEKNIKQRLLKCNSKNNKLRRIYLK